MNPWAAFVSLAACALGGGLGLYAMVNPGWASRLVRLVPKEGAVEGRSEFRATYGGLFLIGHAFAAWALLTYHEGGIFAAAAIGACWLGAGAGRLISFVLDRAATSLNVLNVGFEVVLGLALLSPLLTWRS